MPFVARRVCWFLLVLLLSAPAQAADTPLWVAKTITKLPRTHEELAAAHAASKAASIQVAVGDPLEIEDFAGKTEYDVTVTEKGKKVAKKLPYDYSRLGVVSYGMQLTPEDQEKLPSVSKSRILSRVGGNYISIQLRVHRDQSTGHVYLYYKPFAAIGTYGQPGAQEFAALMEDSVRDCRGLGLFVGPGEKPSAEAFRTFVGINRDTLAKPNPTGGDPILEPHYELFFVRARVNGDQVELHSFNTSEYMTRLNYLRPYKSPETLAESDIDSTIFFTAYTAAKQSPSAKAAWQIDIRPRSYFEIAQLDEFAKSQGMQGDFLDNLTAVLDAIIDGKVEPTFKSESSRGDAK
ncbi:MAG: hypothetical protein KF708_10620 [Pirellulales bacterium]|nr:hypothetical protein [Pirellulales bacterium]